jgi:hypothetical protein
MSSFQAQFSFMLVIIFLQGQQLNNAPILNSAPLALDLQPQRQHALRILHNLIPS